MKEYPEDVDMDLAGEIKYSHIYIKLLHHLLNVFVQLANKRGLKKPIKQNYSENIRHQNVKSYSNIRYS
jgi:hypothetical protein